VLFGGEAVEPRWVREVMVEGGPERLLHVYGPTETTTYATWYHVQQVEEGAATIPIGRPIANTEAYVLDGRMQPVPIGVPGELYIGGPGLARGYLGRPELTAEKFVANPFSDEVGARLYKTGDLVRYLADGNLVYLGRIDHQVKLRGFRIELGEIESTLRRHAGVRESVVLLREDAPEQKRLTAYVVPAGPSRPSARELRAFLRKVLPDYMVPSAFVLLDKLPLTPNGKVDRRALPAPEQDALSEEREDAYVAPRDELEERLAGIWKEALGVERVGIHDDFFELGGYSLAAVSVIAQIEKVVGRRLPVPIMFQVSTVAQLAEVLRSGREKVSWRSAVAIQPHGTRPPFFYVQEAGFGFILRGLAQHLGSDQPLYALRAQQKMEQTVPLGVEDMAASYIRELREVQPEGPYFLGGYCLGGVLAFEVARQLREQGQDVALLALLDARRPKYRPQQVTARSPLDYHAHHLRRLGLRRYLRRVVWRRHIKRKARRKIVFKWAHRSWFPLPRADKELYILKQRALRALRPYKARPYPGRITLFRAADSRISQISADNEDCYGWDSVAAGGVEVYKVPGKHGQILNEQHVEAFAAQLKACLERAQTSSS
jgi:thioesterase domain-containing protein/acyl carrier protein